MSSGEYIPQVGDLVSASRRSWPSTEVIGNPSCVVGPVAYVSDGIISIRTKVNATTMHLLMVSEWNFTKLLDGDDVMQVGAFTFRQAISAFEGLLKSPNNRAAQILARMGLDVLKAHLPEVLEAAAQEQSNATQG